MKIVCLFPGYGSQFVGMAKELYDEYRIVQEYFEEASHCLDTNFVKLCFASSDAELSKMNNAYTATFVVSSSIYALLLQKGVVPSCVVGFNQGEVSALSAVKSFAFPDGLYLLSKYASFYQQLLSDRECSITHIKGFSEKKLQTLCKKIEKLEGPVAIALYRGVDDYVVAGTTSAVDLLRKEVLEHPEVTVDDQPLELGLHMALMETVMDQMRIYREKVDFKDTTVPFMSGTAATMITQGDQLKEYSVDSLGLPIHWDKVMHALADYDLIIEIGPGSMLTQTIAKKYPEKRCIAINKKADIQELEALLAQHKGADTNDTI
jgi:[acyl-carrier-protein] S-malonyltransferase